MVIEKSFSPEIENVNEFLERFTLQNNDVLTAANDDSRKKASILSNALPISVITDLQRRLKPKKLTEATYEDIRSNLIASYGVKKSTTGAAVSFVTRKQKPTESIEDYSKALNEFCSQAEYKPCCRDRLLRDIFISGLQSTKLISALITECEDKSFAEVVNKAKLLHQVTQDVEDMNPTSSSTTHRLQNDSRGNNNSNRKNYSNTNRGSNNSANRGNSGHKTKRKPPQDYKCIRCNFKGQHYVNDCFAINLECSNCQQVGHIARACRSQSKEKAKKSTNYLEPEEDDEYTQYIQINHLTNVSELAPAEPSSASTRTSFSPHAHENIETSGALPVPPDVDAPPPPPDTTRNCPTDCELRRNSSCDSFL